jgi:flagellar M-ring protein FliF
VEQAWWQERDNVADMTGWGVWALAALLGYLLLARPLLRVVTQRYAPQLAAGRSAPSLPSAAAAAGANALPNLAGAPAIAGADSPAAVAPPLGAAAMPVVPLLENYDLPPAGSAVDVMVDHLKVLAGKEPERVAEVVKQWVQKKHGRSEQ